MAAFQEAGLRKSREFHERWYLRHGEFGSLCCEQRCDSGIDKEPCARGKGFWVCVNAVAPIAYPPIVMTA